VAWARLAAVCDSGLFHPLGRGADVATGAVVALARQHDQPGDGQPPHDAPDPGGLQVMHRTRQPAGRPRLVFVGAAGCVFLPAAEVI